MIAASFTIGQTRMRTDIGGGGVVKVESCRLSWPLLWLLIDPRLPGVLTCLQSNSHCGVCDQAIHAHIYYLHTNSYHHCMKGLFSILGRSQAKKTTTNFGVLTSR